jgi:hypothetical protein
MVLERILWGGYLNLEEVEFLFSQKLIQVRKKVIMIRKLALSLKRFLKVYFAFSAFPLEYKL